MRKSILLRHGAAACLLGTAAWSSQAHADGVTLYGIIDASVNYVSNQGGAHAVQAQSGMINGSRWGIKGTEDLGGGTRAIFQLENGFNLFNGKLSQGGREFGRQAWVGLQDDRYGTLTLGRQYDPTIWYLATNTAGFIGGTAFAHPFDNDNMGNSFRLDNAVQYASPSWRGLSMRGMYAFSNQANGFTTNRAYSAGAGYANGPISLGTAFIVIDNVGTTAGGAVDGSGTGDATFIGTRQAIWGINGTYQYGHGKYGFSWTHSLVTDGTAVNLFGYKPLGGSDLSFDNFEVSAQYQWTPSVSLIGSYTYTLGRVAGAQGTFHPKWHQLNAQAVYYFSKRTDVYLDVIYQHVVDGENTPFAGAILCGYSQSASPSQMVVGLGLRHRF